MIWVEVKGSNGRYQDPFAVPLTEAMLRTLRARFREQTRTIDAFGDVPQTRARGLLADLFAETPDAVAPRGVDAILCGFAISGRRLRVNATTWPDEPAIYADGSIATD